MKTVYIGMSGGVDSSVAAALLLEQGYSVVGVYMKNWTQDVKGVACPWKQDLADAKAAAVMLDIPFKIFDFQTEYYDRVVRVMIGEYQAGRTPNPDILCNQEIKFKLFLETALAEGADLVATGHYAAINDGRLCIPLDRAKDQTYFLYRMPKTSLDRVLFPLALKTKPEVRRLAADLDLITATKPDSQGICFVGEVGIKAFLGQYVDAKPGPIIDSRTGRMVGNHDGAIFYTIGQRHGLDLGGGTPYYVNGKNLSKNEVYVTTDGASLVTVNSSFHLEDELWIGSNPVAGRPYAVRIRHRGRLLPCTLTQSNGSWVVQLQAEERAITTGQSAVIYDGEVVMGGGFISTQSAMYK